MAEGSGSLNQDAQRQAHAGYRAHPTLTLTCLDGALFRLPDGTAEMVAIVEPPCTALGRSPDADIQVDDLGEKVSRSHLILEARGATWWAYDDFSSHGTSVRVSGRRPSGLPAGVGIPIEHGLIFFLAGEIAIRCAVKRPALRGRRTAEPLRRSQSLLALADGDQLDIAEAVVRHRNAEQAFHHLTDSGRVTTTRSRFRRSLRDLANHPAVRDSYGDELARRGKDPSTEVVFVEALAGALHSLFPALDPTERPVAHPPTSGTDRSTASSLLTEAERQLRDGGPHGAGSAAGVALERHLGQLANQHGISLGPKAGLNQLNDALRGGGVYDTPRWRQIQHLADIRNMAAHDGPRPPRRDEVDELIRGVRQILSAVR